MARTGRGSEIFAAGAGRVRGSLKVRVQWIYSVTSLLDYYLILSENRLTELTTNCQGMEAQLESLKEAEEFEKEMAGILLKSGFSSMKSNPKKLLHTSAARSQTKGSINRSRRSSRWNRKKGPADDLIEKFEKVKSPNRYSSETIKFDFDSNERSSRGDDESSCSSTEINNFPLALGHKRSYSEGRLRIENTSRKYLPSSILLMKSSIQAAELLNHPILKQLYISDRGVANHISSGSKKSKTDTKKKQSFPSLILPPHAPQITQTRKREFLTMLYSSRGKS